jgi:hypothetical protein
MTMPIINNSTFAGRFNFGSIHYDDFFGDTHVSKFCFMLDPNAIIDSKRMINIEPCAHWNCMDDSCKNDKEKYKIDVAASNARDKRENEYVKKMQLWEKCLAAIPQHPCPPPPE